MATTNQSSTQKLWNSTQAFAVAGLSLAIGIAVGFYVHRSQTPASSAMAPAPQVVETASTGAVPPLTTTALPSPAQLKQAADQQAAPMLEQLKTQPQNVDLLIGLGNIYYDAKQYPSAIDYYSKALKIRPEDTSVRTDMGTAYWYSGNADSAIAEFKKTLTYDPNKADTLFNLGIVEMQGKKDAPAALSAWQKLLDTNPNYPNKENVLQLMAQAKGN